MTLRSLALFLAAPVVLASLALACGGKVIGEAATSPDASGPTTSDEVDAGPLVIPADAAIATTSASGCSAPALTCSDHFPAAEPYSSSTAKSLVGVWITCASNEAALGDNEVGEEFLADGTYYSLIPDASGNYVRDLDPSHIGSWSVSAEGSHGGFQIVISFDDGTLYNEAGLSTCPRALVDGTTTYLPANKD